MIKEKQETPCGRCDIGIYSELALLSKKSREFGAMSKKERCKNMPMCKGGGHICFGARDFHDLINKVDKFNGDE